jgi:tRNA dimethylallyltransferase
MPPREAVYANIDRRFEEMFENGAVREVEHLIARGLDPGLPVMKALGVSQIASFLSGALSHDDAIMQAKRDSRHYAKRQMTWIRNNFISKITLNELYSKSLVEKIFPKIFL